MALMIGCSTADDDDAADDDDDTVGGNYPSTPGIYCEVTDTHMAGTYAMTSNVSCYGQQGFYTMSGGSGDDFIDVHTTSAPQAGDHLVSPDTFIALFFNDMDGDYYPDDVGSCELNVDLDWPDVLATFSCSGLEGTGTGVPFSVVDGVVVCPLQLSEPTSE